MSELSFHDYIRERDADDEDGVGAPARYAYGPDLQMLRSFKKMRPIERAAGWVVKSYRHILQSQYLGQTIRVGPRQLPQLHALVEECAATLGIPVPTVYVANSHAYNAFTFGTDDHAIIVIYSRLVEEFEEDELRFVIGHEMGHIQNKHVVYGTVLQVLRAGIAPFLAWIAPFAETALASWSRRAEVTCDRAGLICVKDVEVAERVFLKMALGSATLSAELDVEAFLEQMEDARKSPGRFTEMLALHPYLPKRIAAVRVFAESELYLRTLPEPDPDVSVSPAEEGTPVSRRRPTGLTMIEADREVSEILQVLKGAPRDSSAAVKEES